MKLAHANGLAQTELIGWLFTLWGEILAEKHDLDRALELVKRGIELTKQGKNVTLLGSSYLCLIRVLFSQQEFDQATAIIREINTLTPQFGLSAWITHQLSAWQARIWVAQDRLESAIEWADACDFDIDGDLQPIHGFDYVVLARVFIAQGRPGEIHGLLQRLHDAAETGGRISKALELSILQALAYQAEGATGQALAALQRALSAAEPEGFVGVFVDEGEPMAQLLHEALSQGIAPEYVRHLLAAFHAAGSQQPDSPDTQATTPDWVEPLSEREVEVLELVAEGLTNQEVASRLFLSPHTIKVHIRNIYSKLDVHNRTQAVARARTFGLLST